MNGIRELLIEGIGLDGDGVGRDEEGPGSPAAGGGRGGGAAVFVAGTAPGDRVRVRTFGRGRPAELLEVLEPSPDRTVPACGHFGRCGGCQLQHVAYPAQLAAKRTALAHAVGRVVDPMVAAPSPWDYRSRVRLHVERGEVGLRAARSHEIVAIRECPVLEPAIRSAALGPCARIAPLVGTRAEILVDRGREGLPVLLVRPAGEPPAALYAQLQELVDTGEIAGAALALPDVPTRARFGDPDPVATAADGRAMRIAPGSFAQANAAVTRLLGERLLGHSDRTRRHWSHVAIVVRPAPGVANHTLGLPDSERISVRSSGSDRRGRDPGSGSQTASRRGHVPAGQALRDAHARHGTQPRLCSR